MNDKTKVANCIAYVRSTIKCDKLKLELELSKDEANGKTRANSSEFDAKCRKYEHLVELEMEYSRLLDAFMKGEIK